MSRSSSAVLPEHIRRSKSDKIRMVIFQIVIASLKGHRTELKSHHISLGSPSWSSVFVRPVIRNLRSPSLVRVLLRLLRQFHWIRQAGPADGVPCKVYLTDQP